MIYKYSKSSFIHPISCILKLGLPRRRLASASNLKTKPFEVHNLQQQPPIEVTLSTENATKYYKQMNVIRKMEQACAKLYTEKAIRGFCHLYSGQEAVAVGTFSQMRPVDTVITSYRCHGWAYLMSDSILEVIAELLGFKDGCSRGKGGSMHMYTKNFYGGNGIVGGHVSLGAGLGFTHKYKNDGGVCLVLYGDGAANQGQVYESYNMAALWSLPVIFICENNKYAMGTSNTRSSANPVYYNRSEYIPGIKVDGMDIISVQAAIKFSLNYVTSGKGPIILEMETYRYFGHSMSDPGISYRSRDEVTDIRKNRDPITSFKEKIITLELCTEDELKKVENEAKVEVDDSLSKAAASKNVGLEELTADIYVNYDAKIANLYLLKGTLKHINIGKPININ